MPKQPFRKLFRIAGSIALILSVSSCSRSEARRPSVDTEAVMQVIRDYGRGHQSLLAPGSTEKPEQTDEAYSAHIRNILVQEDFAQLEKIAKQDRAEKGRLIGGVWKVVGFYNGTSTPADEGVSPDSDWQLLLAKLQKWSAANPDSTTVRLSLAYFYLNYAWRARGTGLANTVGDTQWKAFYERTARSKTILIELASSKEKDPFWYQLMQIVAENEGWDKAKARELFDRAIAFEPGYYHYYIEYARYLMPRWYGEPGEIQTFADETVRRVPEPDGSMLYFWIFSTEVCYCKEDMEALTQVPYPKLRQGYANINKFYGLSNLNANRFAFMAGINMDKPSAHEAFASVVKMDEDIWRSEQTFEQFRTWANAP